MIASESPSLPPSERTATGRRSPFGPVQAPGQPVPGNGELASRDVGPTMRLVARAVPSDRSPCVAWRRTSSSSPVRDEADVAGRGPRAGRPKRREHWPAVDRDRARSVGTHLP